MDHTASVYLLDSDAQFVGTVDYQEDTDTVMAKLKRLVGA
jgi:protein SCO1/2